MSLRAYFPEGHRDDVRSNLLFQGILQLNEALRLLAKGTLRGRREDRPPRKDIKNGN